MFPHHFDHFEVAFNEGNVVFEDLAVATVSVVQWSNMLEFYLWPWNMSGGLRPSMLGLTFGHPSFGFIGVLLWWKGRSFLSW